MNTNKINWTKAILAGVAGTIAFDIVGFLFTGQWFDIAALLGDKTGLGFTYGLLGHYANGILLGILYAGIAPSLPGSSFVKAQLFVIAETVALVWFFMFPLLGAGVAGLQMSKMLPLVSLLRHVAYGIPLWYFVHKFTVLERKEAIV
ncbi:hypothetical protein [Labilibacter marinus]|uniref:hypothetical protein n=1 Tax=Labilibacter marinus TaxID=1477105 RepID=UPI00083393E9|nr:hypothetical protein [Labilibacter marinus]